MNIQIYHIQEALGILWFILACLIPKHRKDLQKMCVIVGVITLVLCGLYRLANIAELFIKIFIK